MVPMETDPVPNPVPSVVEADTTMAEQSLPAEPSLPAVQEEQPVSYVLL